MPTPIRLDPDTVRAALNGDPEFRLQSRYWNTTFRLIIGDDAMLVRLIDGEVHSVDPHATPFDAWDFQLAGTADHWRGLLACPPAAFYQDYYAAMLYHGFRIEGDMKEIMAHYPAIRRSLDVLRTVAAQAVAA